MTTWVQAPEDLVPDVEHAEAGIRELHRELAEALQSGEAVLELGGRRWRAGPALLQFVEDSLTTLDAGGKLGYVAEDDLLSPAQAGELLGVSRPFIYKLMETRELPVAQVRGSHSKLAARDVLAWRDRQLRRVESAEDVAAQAETLVAGRDGVSVKSGRALAREALAAVRAGDAAALAASEQEAKAARVAAALGRRDEAVAEELVAAVNPVPARAPRVKTGTKVKKLAAVAGAGRAVKVTEVGRIKGRVAASKSVPSSLTAAAKTRRASAAARTKADPGTAGRPERSS